ncbi:hypothetical protein LXL04_001656 [Taraxacum kok-saghyz]
MNLTEFGSLQLPPNCYTEVQKKDQVVEPQPDISVTLPPSAMEEMGKRLLGRFKDYQRLNGFQNSWGIEGWGDVTCKYLGGLSIMLEFRDKQAARDFLQKAKEKWSQWFMTLNFWNEDHRNEDRFTSLYIRGVPLHAWRKEVFSEIAKLWGKVILPEECSELCSD